MKAKVPAFVLHNIVDKTDESFETYLPYFARGDSDKIVTVELDNMDKKHVKTLKKELEKSKGKKACVLALNYIKRYEKLLSNVKGAKISALNQFPLIMKAYLKEHTERCWLFEETPDDAHLPYVVTNVTYSPPSQYTSAHVTISLAYIFTGESSEKVSTTSIRLHTSDMQGTLVDILLRKGYFFETKDAVKNYDKEIDGYKEIVDKIGHQYVSGMKGRYRIDYGVRYEPTKTAGTLHKLVVDEELDGTLPNPHTESQLSEKVEGEEDERVNVLAPFHCLIKLYDLERYADVHVHVSNLKEYEYDETVIEKIVLKEENRELLDILIGSDTDIMEDIIEGKTGGIIVMCSGVAGIGKTLTAEVYSETMKKPLYKVQSSQLGIELDQIEKNLKDALARADKWNAILLIDEADTYVHERGDNIFQNCVVGVFLRILEYYRGIMFMTTNRGTKIDDAILSRCTAHIRYELPNESELKEIWGILAAQAKIDLPKEEIDKIIEKYPVMSGRDVKSTLKLCKKMAESKKEDVGVDMVGRIEKFLNYTNKEEERAPAKAS